MNILVKRAPLTFLADVHFLRSGIRRLVPGPNEHGMFVSGPQLRGLRVLSWMSKRLQYSENSPVYLKATVRSTADAQIAFCMRGCRAHCWWHSHPGAGPYATHPSGIDWRYLSNLTFGFGAEVIGLISTRDGYLRVYAQIPFRFIITGKGYEKVDESTFYIGIRESGARERDESSVVCENSIVRPSRSLARFFHKLRG
jgi:hypothetical protein